MHAHVEASSTLSSRVVLASEQASVWRQFHNVQDGTFDLEVVQQTATDGKAVSWVMTAHMTCRWAVPCVASSVPQARAALPGT